MAASSEEWVSGGKGDSCIRWVDRGVAGGRMEGGGSCVESVGFSRGSVLLLSEIPLGVARESLNYEGCSGRGSEG